MNTQKRTWYKLDNAAKMVPGTTHFANTRVFRICCELTEEVDPAILQEALDATVRSFPYFNSVLRTGLFWYYLEEIREPLIVRQDAGHPCMPFRFKQDHGYLLRVFYFRNRISAEFFHSLTDGSGGLIFIKTDFSLYSC